MSSTAVIPAVFSAKFYPVTVAATAISPGSNHDEQLGVCAQQRSAASQALWQTQRNAHLRIVGFQTKLTQTIFPTGGAISPGNFAWYVNRVMNQNATTANNTDPFILVCPMDSGGFIPVNVDIGTAAYALGAEVMCSQIDNSALSNRGTVVTGTDGTAYFFLAQLTLLLQYT